MINLNALELTQLSKHFREMGSAIQDYRRVNFEHLSKEEDQLLSDSCIAILRAANQGFVKATLMAFDDAESFLKIMDDLTAQIRQTLKKLANIQQVIDIATTVASLATCILHDDSHFVSQTLDKLLSLLD
ncbi:MAG: hypothetical protein NTV75_10490 [Bacteroidia bacterium]|nr:hypothetical protein [Bacteroidia bacterium]